MTMDEFDKAVERLQTTAFDILKDWQRYRTALQMIAEGYGPAKELAEMALKEEQ